MKRVFQQFRLGRWIIKVINERSRARSYGRVVFEEVLLPAVYERPGMQRVLFIGVCRRTRDYPERFRDREFWTLDMDPDAAHYGAERHVVDSVVNVRDHFEAESLDAVICVSVLGWGLDTGEDIEVAIAGCAECLRPGGLLVLGWNDFDGYRPPPLEQIEALRRFEPVVLSPFTSPKYPTFSEMRLVFETYERARS